MESFLSKPSVEAVETLGRKDQIAVLKELKVEYSITLTSRVLKDRIMVHFINEGIFDENLLLEVLAREEKPVDRALEARIAVEKEELAVKIAVEKEELAAKIALDKRRLELEFERSSYTSSSIRSELEPSQLSVGQVIANFGRIVPKFSEFDLVVFFSILLRI